MLHGRLVFDGQPEELTKDVVRDIYGANQDLDEAVTSTSICFPSSKPANNDIQPNVQPGFQPGMGGLAPLSQCA